MRDLIERSVWTGVETGMGMVILDGLDIYSQSAQRMLVTAAAAAGLAAFKCFASERLAALRARRRGEHEA